MQVRHNKFTADIQTGQIKLGIYLITVLFSLFYSFQSGKDDLFHNMLTAVIILGIGGYYTIGKKKDGTFYAAKRAFAVLWATLYFILPIHKMPAPDNTEYFLKRVLDAFRSSESALIFYALFFWMVLNIFGNKFKNSLVYFIGIYISQYLIVSEIFRITFRIDAHFIFLITVYALLNDFVRSVVYRQKSQFKMLLLLYLILYVLIILYPDDGFVTRIQNLFYLEEVWPHVSSILLISGAICIFENYKNIQDLSSGEMTGEFVEGCAFITLAVYIFVGKGWSQYYHLLIVYAAFPAIVLLKEYVGNHIVNSRAVLLYWVCVLFCLPALGRTLNENRRYYLVLLGLFIIRHILLKVSWKGGKEIIMQDYWGIAAAILLFTARHNVFDMNIIQNLFHPLLVLIGSCVLWVRLTHDTYTFNKQLIEGKYSKKDYKKTLKIQKAVLILVMAIVLFTLLT